MARKMKTPAAKTETPRETLDRWLADPNYREISQDELNNFEFNAASNEYIEAHDTFFEKLYIGGGLFAIVAWTNSCGVIGPV